MSHNQQDHPVSFDVDPDFVMPDLDGLDGAGRVDRAESVLVSTYHDTADHALLAQGVTLCRHSGAEDGWELTVPAKRSPTRIQVPSTDEPGIPTRMNELVTGVVGDRPLITVATVTTRRLSHRMLDDAGELLTLTDDHVTASAAGDGSAVASAWREVRLEAVTAPEPLLGAVRERVRDAGARPSSGASTLRRALQEETMPAPRLPVPASLISDYLRAQHHAVLIGDIAFRSGDDPTHATRVATRRLRSTLRIFGSYLDPEAARRLDTELAWYAGLLGTIRDRKLQRAHFAAAIAALPAELVLGPVAANIDEWLLSEELRLRENLLNTLDGARYRALLADLAEWAARPPFLGAVDEVRDLLGDVATARRKAHKRLRKGLAKGADDAVLHRARKSAKRARYAVELAAPLLGRRRSARAVDAYKKVQDVLGAHQDSVLATDMLRTFAVQAGTTPGQNGFTYGLLYAREAEIGARTRRRARAVVHAHRHDLS